MNFARLFQHSLTCERPAFPLYPLSICSFEKTKTKTKTERMCACVCLERERDRETKRVVEFLHIPEEVFEYKKYLLSIKLENSQVRYWTIGTSTRSVCLPVCLCLCLSVSFTNKQLLVSASSESASKLLRIR
jgi:hypothetical protein